ncbi:MAG: hypothetical protein IPM47_03755 [Sphingobacteriales bacterium]|nr:MAG: hypothetical protein IPM47_03755 [Sphingobacteriales bacterium]
MYKEQPVWYYTIQQPDHKRVILFINDYLKAAEKQDFIRRIEIQTEGYSLNAFYLKQDTFGTLALLTNLAADRQPEQIYQQHKTRTHIEQLFDVFKNILHAERTYMRGGTEMETWMFVNFLASIYYYQLFRRYTPLFIHYLGIKHKSAVGNHRNTQENSPYNQTN